MNDLPHGESGSAEGDGSVMSPEALLETLSAQANDAAMFPGSLREEYMFIYDLLLDQSLISRLVKGMPLSKIVRLPHHRLVWPYYYPPAGSALPSLLRTNREQDHVWGVLYNSQGKDLKALNEHLKVPNRYHRRGVVTQDRGDRRITAFTYVLSLTDPVMGKPSRQYLDQLLSVAQERELPGEWIAYLQGLETAETVNAAQ